MAQVEGALLLRRIRKLAGDGRSLLTDSQLLQQYVAERDEDAIAALVKRHAPMVLRVCRGILHHQQDAEDACQAAFLVFARKAHTIGNRAAIGSWLYCVAYRAACRARAQAKRRNDREQVSASPLPVSTNDSDELNVRELQAILHEELQRLPEKFRTPLLMCYWEGKTRDEAAEQLSTTVDAFKKRLERARRLLGSRLTNRGFVPSTGCFTTLFLSDDRALAVSSDLIAKISQAAVTFAVGNKATIALPVAALAEGVIRTMNQTKWATVILSLAFIGALGSGIGYQVVQSKQPDGPAVAAAAAEQQRLQQPDKDKPNGVKADNEGKAASKEPAKLVPQAPHKIRPHDILAVHVANVLPEEPIAGLYSIDREGYINFGIIYGDPILVVDLTLAEAKKKIEQILRREYKTPLVELSFPHITNLQDAGSDSPTGSRAFKLYRGFLERAANNLEQARVEFEQTKAAMRKASPLDLPGLKSRLAASQIALDDLNLREQLLTSRLKTIQKGLDEKTDKATLLAFANLSEKLAACKIESIDQYVFVLKQQLEAISGQRSVILRTIDECKTSAGKLEDMTDKASALEEKCKQLRRQLDHWEDRMQDLELSEDGLKK